MHICLEGVGFESPVEIELHEGDSLIEALVRQHASAQHLPWKHLVQKKQRNLSLCNWVCLQWLKCEGRSVRLDCKALGRRHVRIEIVGKLCGGGGDGGSTGAESRDAYLNMYKLPKADKVDATEERLAKWTCCQLSGESLTPPCVCDELGTLFNKEAVIKALIDKTMPRSLSHISSLKHIIPLNLTPKNATREVKSVKDAKNYQMARDAEIKFCCPVSDLELNGCFRFSVHLKTGHVMSDKAIKEAPKAVEEILGMECTSEDWLPLNGTPEIVKSLKDKMIQTRSKSKKSKKRPQVKSESQTSTKKPRATDFTPEEASKRIYASIFSSDDGRAGETFLCRSVGARGMNLT